MIQDEELTARLVLLPSDMETKEEAYPPNPVRSNLDGQPLLHAGVPAIEPPPLKPSASSSWAQFKLLVWKNLTVKKRNSRMIFFEVVMPILLVSTQVPTAALIHTAGFSHRSLTHCCSVRQRATVPAFHTEGDPQSELSVAGAVANWRETSD